MEKLLEELTLIRDEKYKLISKMIHEWNGINYVIEASELPDTDVETIVYMLRHLRPRSIKIKELIKKWK